MGEKCVILSLFLSNCWISPFALTAHVGVFRACCFLSIFCICCFHLISQLLHARCSCPVLPSHFFLPTFCHSLFSPFFLPGWLLLPSGPSYLTFCNRKKSHTSPKKASPHFCLLSLATRRSKWILLFIEQSMPNYSERIAHAQFGRDIAIQMEHALWTGHKSLLDICWEIFSRDVWLDEILANFHSKGLFFNILP